MSAPVDAGQKNVLSLLTFQHSYKLLVCSIQKPLMMSWRCQKEGDPDKMYLNFSLLLDTMNYWYNLTYLTRLEAYFTLLEAYFAGYTEVTIRAYTQIYWPVPIKKPILEPLGDRSDRYGIYRILFIQVLIEFAE